MTVEQRTTVQQLVTQRRTWWIRQTWQRRWLGEHVCVRSTELVRQERRTEHGQWREVSQHPWGQRTTVEETTWHEVSR